MTSAANTGNAIERLRYYCVDGDLYAQEDMEASLAAVEALYQAALEATHWRNSSLGNDYPATKEALDALAAAVRRVEGE